MSYVDNDWELKLYAYDDDDREAEQEAREDRLIDEWEEERINERSDER